MCNVFLSAQCDAASGVPMDVRFGTWNVRNLFIRDGEDNGEMMSRVKIEFNESP
jgi:hypothetical protein